jgi:CHAT domain-containing protein/tetratricopeptide (TPR) repeat protein
MKTTKQINKTNCLFPFSKRSNHCSSIICFLAFFVSLVLLENLNVNQVLAKSILTTTSASNHTDYNTDNNALINTFIHSSNRSFNKTFNQTLENTSNNTLNNGLFLSQNQVSSSQQRAIQLQKEAEKLTQQGTGESKLQAIQKYEEALKIWKQLGNKDSEATTLLSIGTLYYTLNQNQKALNYFTPALEIRKQLKDKKGEAIMLYSVAGAYYGLGDRQKALLNYNQALSIFKAEKEFSLAGRNLISIGRIYFDLGNKQKSIDSFNEALQIYRQNKDGEGEAEAAQSLALVYTQTGEPQKAIELLNQVLTVQRQQKNLKIQAETLNYLAFIYSSIGDNKKSLETLQEAVAIQKQIQSQLTGVELVFNLSSQAQTSLQIASIYKDENKFSQALDSLKEALALLKKAGNRHSEAEVLNQMSFVYKALGENKKAIEVLNQALVIQQEIKEVGRQGFTLSNIADIYADSGDYQRSLDTYNQALAIAAKSKNRSLEASIISSIAKLYRTIGDYQLSIETFNKSLSINKEIGNKSGEANALENIGSVYHSLKDFPKALIFYNQALVIWREQKIFINEFATLTSVVRAYESLKDYPKALEVANQVLDLGKQQNNPFQLAVAYSLQGIVYRGMGDNQKALSLSKQAIEIFEKIGFKLAEANAINNLGKTYNALKQYPQAIESYNRQLLLRQQLADKPGQAESLYYIAINERDKGNFTSSRKHIEDSINIVEQIRGSLVSNEQRSAFFASVQQYYKFYTELLMEMHRQEPGKGFDAQALQVSEQGRARSLLDLLTEANANIRQGVNPSLLAQEKDIQQKLNAAEKRLTELANGKYTEEGAQAIQTEITTLQNQYQQLQNQIRANSPRYASLTQPQPLTLPEIQRQVLDDDTILLQYSLGEKQSYLWVVTNNSVATYQLPKEADIEKVAKEFYKLSSGGGRQNSSASVRVANQLSQMLLQPASNLFTGKQVNKRLLIVADGALQYIPFAALPIPNTKEPLLAKHEIVNLPSASTLGVLRKETQGRKMAPKTLAIFADPVFTKNDERLKSEKGQELSSNNIDNQTLNRASRDSGITFDRLPFTRQEAETIIRLVPEGDRQQSLDFNASRNLATSPELEKYRIVHFATHGILNSTHPELSGLVLSLFNNQGQAQNGFLRLSDIFNLKLASDLVVLSACETGLGEEVKGEGLVGLTRGFMYAGAPRVVVSLWSVDDEATAVLMGKFYKKMLQDKLKPAAALRGAQLEMIKETEFSAPYYWAAFTLQGEWK